jgi:hypothetical protein
MVPRMWLAPRLVAFADPIPLGVPLQQPEPRWRPAGARRTNGFYLVSPSLVASAAAWVRVRTLSLRRIAETWWSTVFSDTTSRWAI